MNRFIAFGNGGTYSIAYSLDGVSWNSSSTASSSLFSTAACGGEASTTLPHQITFPSNYTIAGNTISADYGNTWGNLINTSTSTSALFSGEAATAVCFDGTKYVFARSYNFAVTRDLYNYSTVSLSDINYISVIKHNGSLWLAGGTTASGATSLAASYDGYNWRTVASDYIMNSTTVNGIAWNGSYWIVSARNSSNYGLTIYSYDGFTWAMTSSNQLSSSAAAGGPIEWNGSLFIAGGPYDVSNTYISLSQTGLYWSVQNLGQNGPVTAITSNGAGGTSWVIGTSSTKTSANPVYTSTNNGTSWTASSTSTTSGNIWLSMGAAGSIVGAVWNGMNYVLNVNNTNSSGNRYAWISYDGLNWSNKSVSIYGEELAFNNPHVGTAQILQPVVAGGVGTSNTMAISKDGIFYSALGNGVFGEACYAVEWNGTLYVAGGTGNGNTLAYSYDGVSWTGLGASIFSTACYGLRYNGSYWVAVGAGTYNTMAYSSDGITWSGLGTDTFDLCGNSVDWNGTAWVAGGAGTTNTLAYISSSNPASYGGWAGLGKTIFSSQCTSVRWINSNWVATGAGGNTLAYCSSVYGYQVNWTGLGRSIFTTQGNTVFWNGTIVLAGGYGTTNTMAYSTDGTSWSGLGSTVFTNSCNSITWNTKRWVAAGSGGGNTIAYSYNGTRWYGVPSTSNSIFSSAGMALGTNSRMGVVATNSALYLNKNDRLVVNSPAYYDDSLMSDTSISFTLNLS
jgi:hypothetical protein